MKTKEFKEFVKTTCDENYTIGSKTIDKVLNLHLPKQMEIFPTMRDTIQIEWEKDKNYIEVELYNDHNTLYIQYADGTEVDREIDDWEIEKVLSKFIENFGG